MSAMLALPTVDLGVLHLDFGVFGSLIPFGVLGVLGESMMFFPNRYYAVFSGLKY